MNESVDEPGLSSRLHSWARIVLNPLRAGSLHPDLESSQNHVLPQNASNTTSDSTSSTVQDDLVRPKDTVLEDSPVVDKKGDGEKSAPVTGTTRVKPPMSKRLFSDVKYIMFCSWINILLIFVPVGIVLGAMVKSNENHPIVSPSIVFAINAVAIIPLASLLSFATESVASKLGDTIGALLNVTFGNAVELIIFIIALVANETRIVQASLIGSILSNLLLILGMCFVFGGLRFREQVRTHSRLLPDHNG